MTWIVRPGSRVEGELEVVDDASNARRKKLRDAFSVRYRLLDRTGTEVATGAAEREAEGVYLLRPTMPANAAVGRTYGLEITVYLTPDDDSPHIELVPLLVGGPSL